MISHARTFTIRLFGPLRITVDGADVPVPGGKPQSLLAYLLLYPQTPHTRDRLVDTLWPDLPADRARRALADTLYRLRAALGGRVVQSSGEQIGLETGPRLDVDLWEFEALAAQGSAAGLDRARALYTGPLLPDIYDDWIVARRADLEDRFGALLARRAQMAEEAGDPEAARELFQALIAQDPLHEPAWRGLMRALARLGHLRDALDAYTRLAGLLDEEIGAPPEQASRSLAESIERELDAQSRSAPETQRAAFVGRVRERAQLVALLDAAAAGRGGIAVVLGEAGSGRTALLAELEAAAGWRGLRVAWGRSEPGGYPEPFAPLRQALHAALPPARLQQLESLVPALWVGLVRAVLAEPDAPPDPTPGAQGDAPDQVAQALLSLLRGLGHISPHLLLLDDMQWADPSLWPLLDALREGLEDAGALVVISGRTGELRRSEPAWSLLSRWDQEAGARIVELGPMPRGDLAQLLSARPPGHLAGEAIKGILDACGGNPRLALALAEAGGAADAAPAADVVQRLVLRRFEALSPPARTALQAAAVLGSRFAYALWRQVWESAGLAPAALPPAAGELERQRQLALEGDSYAFVQTPLREAVYAGLPPDARCAWHRHALAALRAAPAPAPILLLRHAVGAGDSAAVAEYATLAGEAALAAHAYASAREDFTLALQHIPAQDHALLYRALLGRSRALGVLALRDEQGQDLDRLQELAARLDDPARQAESACRRAGYFWTTGRLPEALASAQRGLALAESLNDLTLQAQTHEVLGCTYRDGKDAAAAAFHIQEAQRLYQAAGNRWGVAMTTDLLGGLAWDSGRYAHAAQRHQAAADLFRDLGDIVREAKALNNVGSAYWGLGDYAGARETHERALAVCRAAGDRRSESDNVDNLGGVAWSLGDYDGAIYHYSSALRIRRAIHDVWGIAISLGNLGSAHLRKGDPETALAYYAEAYPLYQQVGRKRGEGYVLHHMGVAELERGDPRAALAWLHKARAIRSEVGDLARIVETDAALALASLEAGAQDDALRYVQQALDGLPAAGARATLRQEACFAAYMVFARAGRSEDALLRLAQAERALDDACATLRSDEREQFLANVPLNRKVAEAAAAQARRETLRCARAGTPLGRTPRAGEWVDVTWTVETPADRLLEDGAPRRRHVLQRLVAQAQAQGASPTDDDLAQALAVSRRTILRDIAALGAAGVTVPTRARA